jgi:MFS family permease
VAEQEANGGQIAIETTKKKGSFRELFRDRNFLLYWSGQGTSLIGDQFMLIALPWLVLQITGDSIALGIVLALVGIPRAIFMLLGGALTDRLSPRNVMMASDIGRLLLTAGLGSMILYGHIEMWMLYSFALVFGTMSGIFIPASTSIVPLMVKKEDLQTANSISQGTSQLSVFIGPALAGAVIALLASRGAGTSIEGTGIAFAIDAFSFLVSVSTLGLMVFKSQPQGAKGNILGSIREGIVYVIRDPHLRVLLIIMAFINFLFAGPFLVGVPVVASTRLAGGAAAFGLLMSSFGGGNLLGIILSGILPKPRAGLLGYILAGSIGFFGLCIVIFGLTMSTLSGCVTLAVLGICNGYLNILMITLLQKISPMGMMGRLMSLVMLAVLGLAPISQGITGFLIKYSVEGLFVSVGALFIITALLSLMLPEVRDIGSRVQAAGP